MAVGDLIGDLATAYLTPAQRAAKNGIQSLTGGPIARASGQLPVAVGLAAGATATASTPIPPGANPNPTHLGDYFTNPAQLAQPPQPQSLESVRPVGVTPTATSPTYPTNSQAAASLADGLKQSTNVPALGIQQPINAVAAGRDSLILNPVPDAPVSVPESNNPQPVDSNYRLTGAGSGSNAIAARVGSDGVPEFSNQPADLASAAGAAPVSNGPQMPASLADLSPGGVSVNPSAPFASLGSAANLGDGLGTFSQAQAGDGQLAMTRFNRAADLRDAYAAQDRLKEAQAAQTRDRNFTVVHDSSKPVTSREIKFDQDRAATSQSLADAVTGAQSLINAQRQGVALDQQQRQANRLEDAFTAATAPDATPEQKQRYQALIDPTGSGAQARQLAAAKQAETEASTKKIIAETNALGGPGKLTEGQGKDLQYFSRGNAANAELGQNGLALTSAATGDRGSIRGGIDTALRALPVIGNSGVVNSLISDDRQKAEQSGREFVNAILRKDSGAALTDTEIAEYGRTYLPQPGDGEAVLKQKQEARTRAVQGIKDGLGSAAILAGEVNRPEYKAAGGSTAKTASAAVPTITTKAQADALPAGSVFIGPDGRQYRK